MKGLITLFLAVGLILGVSNAYAQETNVHHWVYGTDATDIASIPTGLDLGIHASVLAPPVNTWSSSVPKASEITLHVPRPAPGEPGIVSVYKEMGLIRYPDTFVGPGGN